MSHMAEKISKGIGIAVGVLFLVFIMLPIVVAFSASVGYLTGMIAAWAVGGLLTGILGITAGNLPVIFAWLFVISAILGTPKAAKVDRK